MNKTELNNLLKKYEELQTELEVLIEKSNGLEIDIDGDEVDELQGKSLILVHDKLAQNNLKKLLSVRNVINLIKSGSYDGTCEECGEDIGIKRLEVIPGVGLCVCCAELSEKYK